MIPLIEQHRLELIELCKQYRVQRLDLFGSAAKGTCKSESSDLDFIVTFQGIGEKGYARRYYFFAESLEQLFYRSVDVLTEPMLGEDYFRQEVNQSRQPVYEYRSQTAT